MAYKISMSLENVRFPEPKALEGLKSILGWESDPAEKFNGDFYTGLKAKIAAVETGEANPVAILKEILEDEEYKVEAVDGFLCLVEWGEDGDGCSHSEGILLAALGSLFEAGGSSWGSGQEGERWCYTFLGGSYELGWVDRNFYVSKEDRQRVQAAWQEEAGQIPEALRVLLHDILRRADLLLPAPASEAKSA